MIFKEFAPLDDSKLVHDPALVALSDLVWRIIAQKGAMK